MKRYLHMRSPENSMELPRRGERKRQTTGNAWDQDTSQQAIGPPRRFYPSTDGSIRKESVAGQQITYPPNLQQSQYPTSQQQVYQLGHQQQDTNSIYVMDSPWTEEEDAVLREGVLRYGNQAWDQVASHMLPPLPDNDSAYRSAADCSARWEAVVKNTMIKGPWLCEEDALLRQLVTKFGPKRWALIASHIPGRAGKQCRERWLNHLDTRVIKSDWTPEEDSILLDAQQRLGNKWSEIAKQLPGRAENAVKNRFNSLITKKNSSQDSISAYGHMSQSSHGLGDMVGTSSISQRASPAIGDENEHFDAAPMMTEDEQPLCRGANSPRMDTTTDQQIYTAHNKRLEQHSNFNNHAKNNANHMNSSSPHHTSFPNAATKLQHSAQKPITPNQTRSETEVEDKTPKELLALMFRRIGESAHIATQIATRLPEIRTHTEDLCLTDADQANNNPPSRQPVATGGGGLTLQLDDRCRPFVHNKNSSQGLDKAAELQGMALAHRFWGHERERNELFKRVAFTASDWEKLEAKAAKHAAERPRDVAFTTAAATAALGHSFNALAAQHRASMVQQQQQQQQQGRPKKQRGGQQLAQPNYCPSPGRGRRHSGGRTKSRGRGAQPQQQQQQQQLPVVPPLDAGQSLTKIVDDTLKLSGTLLHLSLEDPSWLNEVVDVGMSRDPGRDAMKMSWAASPRASMTAARGAPQGHGAQQLGRSSAGGGLFKSYNYDDWANAPLGASALFGVGNTSAFAGSLEPPMAQLEPHSVVSSTTNRPARGTWGSLAVPQQQPQQQQQHQSQQYHPESSVRLRSSIQAHDTTSMSLDNVDWDLILKMSNNTPRHDSVLGAQAAPYHHRPGPNDKQQDSVLYMSQDFETNIHAAAPSALSHPVSRGPHRGLVVEIPGAPSHHGPTVNAPNDDASHLTPRARQLFSHAVYRDQGGRK